MKHPLLATLLAAALPAAAAHAQEASLPPARYPAIPAAAASAAAFVPAGWRIESQVSGDLDGAGAPDIALVLRGRDAAAIIPAEMCENPFDTNPRILIVALAAPGGYRRVVANHALIPRRDNACQMDWFSDGSIRIERGTLNLDLERMMSAGGWDAGTTSFHFQWRNGEIRLIGYDFSNARRNTGEFKSLSINFLTRRAKTTLGNLSSDDESVRWSRLRPAPLPTLDEIGDGLAYDPEGLVARLVE